jgi:TM2 domain-containing membrane protein YozV
MDTKALPQVLNQSSIQADVQAQMSRKHPPHTTLDPERAIDCPDAKILPKDGAIYKTFDVHYSDSCTYVNPDRDYNTAKTLSIFGGLLALDHFYMRSPTTGFLKILVNAATFGLWWIWDANQFAFEKEQVMRYGLSYIFDWGQGIGRGTLTDKKPEYVPKKDFLTFFLLAIFFGFLGLDRMYLGGNFIFQGWVKFLSCFLLIGFIWVLWDMYQVLVQPGSVVTEGYFVPLPFTAMNSDWDKGPANYIGDLFQVTLTREERNRLGDVEGKSASSGAMGAVGAAKAVASGMMKRPTGTMTMAELAKATSEKALASRGGVAGVPTLFTGSKANDPEARKMLAKKLDSIVPKYQGREGGQTGGGIVDLMIDEESIVPNALTRGLFAAVLLGITSVGGLQMFKFLKST